MTVGIACVRGLPRALCAPLLAGLLALAGCGGGDRVSTYVPQRLIVFGDESSVIAGGNLTDVNGGTITALAGAKYSVNAQAVDATGAPTGALDCNTYPLWIQVLGSQYGMGFAQCNTFSEAVPRGKIYAQVGAGITELQAQVIQARTDVGGFVSTDLATVLVGQKDILDAYAQYPAQSADAVVALAEAAGGVLGTQVNALAQSGARVLVATVPNLGATPFGIAQNLVSAERAALLTRITDRFNAGMRAALINDGRLIGLVQADEQLQLLINNPSAYGYVSVSTAACTTLSAISCTGPTAGTTSVPATPGTLVTGATALNYLWADDRHFGVNGHASLGTLAVTRATNNPF
ncbi:hypothetical protein [Methylibium sp.]|uniref:hypothetical protein n=1 Tax=Methylibium sp. TaxID=2067992 RepID=UPI003D110F85